MLIRRERPADTDTSDDVHRRAFARDGASGDDPVEVGLVRALRADPGWIPELSFVAEDASGVVGHVAGSRGDVDGVAAVGLGPIGVYPALQGQAVGHALMHAFLGGADALGYPLVALLGDPDYYGRFGFVAAEEMSIEAPDPSWGAFFQVRTLAAHDAGITGRFRYAAPFDAL